MTTKSQASIEDLYHIPDDGKAEIVNGEIVLMSPTGDFPSYASGQIFVSLHEYARRSKNGRAYSDNVGFIVDLPNRKSFSPDVSFYVGPRAGMKFLEGAPIFAVEVRSEGDYGPSADRKIAAKIKDYFAAGTLVVWDVDLIGVETIKSYFAESPDKPVVYRRGEIASAEPAVPGWTMPVTDLFD